MAARHILYLTNASLVSLVVRGGRVAERQAFPNTGAGHERFEAHAQAHRALPAHVITDLAEEDFRLDTIPHLGGRDREAVLARKLSQLFRNTPYRHAIVQGREPEGRRDDRVVYTAITNPEVLRPWVEALERHSVPLEGIHSSAVFSGRLLAELGLALPHTLLVTITPGGAVRQTYFLGGEIRFSRLTPIDLEPGGTLGGLLAGETARTWQYLDSLRYFTPADRLEVCVVAHAGDQPSIAPELRDYERIRYRMLDIGQVAARLGMKPAPASSSAEEILACLFARRGMENHFAPPEVRRFATLRRARNAILAGAGAALAAGAAFGGWNLALALEAREREQQTLERVAVFQRQSDEIMRAMPLQDVGGETMRDTVTFYARSLRAYPTISGFLQPVSEVLARYPEIRLTQVAWQAADDDKAQPAFAPTVPRESPPVRAVARAPTQVPAGAATPLAEGGDGGFPAGRHAVAVLEGMVTVSGLGFRDALARIDGLVADIGRISGYRAAIVDSPLDVTTRAAIQGRFGDREPAPSQARFSIRVSRTQEPRT
jgi:hypothetical protein